MKLWFYRWCIRKQRCRWFVRRESNRLIKQGDELIYRAIGEGKPEYVEMIQLAQQAVRLVHREWEQKIERERTHG
jgi:hypothetical protein